MINVNRINPISIPVVIEYASGISIIIKNAGIAIDMFFQSIEPMFSIIEMPIIIRIGATATVGTILMIGDINKARKKNKATNKEVSPVFPPASIPAVLSRYVVTLLVPSRDPNTVPVESAIKAFSNFLGNLFSLVILNIPDFFPVPIKIPIESNKSDIHKVKIVINITSIDDLVLNNPMKSKCIKVGVSDGKIV